MFKKATSKVRPLPREFLEWQVALRRHTMEERNGAPHAGVAPLVTVRRPGGGPGFISSSAICGLLPHPDQLERKTREFRQLYEEGITEGARVVYDRGIHHLLDYYRSADDFDPDTLTTLLPKKTALVDALRAEPHAALVFFVAQTQRPDRPPAWEGQPVDQKGKMRSRITNPSGVHRHAIGTGTRQCLRSGASGRGDRLRARNASVHRRLLERRRRLERRGLEPPESDTPSSRCAQSGRGRRAEVFR